MYPTVIELPYGRSAYPTHFAADRRVTVLAPVFPPPAPDAEGLVEDALNHPIGMPRLAALVHDRARVTIIVSDDARDDPRDLMVNALIRALPRGIRVTIAIATGSHGPMETPPLLSAPAEAQLLDHDGNSPESLVSIGTTRRGTSLTVNRCLTETDLIIATGVIRPHYFAGFGGGAKALFPGLGGTPEIRTNHLLKQDPSSICGSVEDNACRQDFEEVLTHLRAPTFLLNLVSDLDGKAVAAFAGHGILAFRAGAAFARRCFGVAPVTAPLVIASDRLPVTSSLYQASKIAAAVAPLVEPGGDLVIVAECPDGTGPLEVVNQGIYAIGIAPRLAAGVSVHLLSGLSDLEVIATYARPTRSLDAFNSDRVVVVPHATRIVWRP
jgi:nickel-dependent lactate racemase